MSSHVGVKPYRPMSGNLRCSDTHEQQNASQKEGFNFPRRPAWQPPAVSLRMIPYDSQYGMCEADQRT
jgi:hypothetical protein